MKKSNFLLPLVFLFSSCIGVNTEITVNKNLSGEIKMEYTVSEDFLKMGTLDGNEAWPVIPAGKADIERSISRIKGLTLKSFSEKNKEDKHIFYAVFDFDNIDTLKSYLNSTGESFVFKQEGGVNTLSFEFGGSEKIQPELKDVVLQAFEGYDFKISVSVPSGEKKSLSIPMGRLITQAQKEKLEIIF